MGSTTDKIKGATNEAVGKAKQGIGEATGSERMSWDGTYKGRPCPDGVYTYKVRYREPNQDEFVKVGHVTLMR